jgi:hypothetical protein
MTVEAEINNCNMDEIIDAMNAYAISRLKSIQAKSFNGKEAIDFVGDLIMKVLEGKRDWSKAQCPFREFLFGCLKSEIDNFFTTLKHKFTDEIPESLESNNNNHYIEQKRKKVVQLLIDDGSDDDEIILFEYWMDGIFKPSLIASDLGVDVLHINNVKKRLVRRLPKVQTKAQQFI